MVLQSHFQTSYLESLLSCDWNKKKLKETLVSLSRKIFSKKKLHFELKLFFLLFFLFGVICESPLRSFFGSVAGIINSLRSVLRKDAFSGGGGGSA